ncbi:ABC transporter ATP-binding protein [Mobilicoccus sp.]|uniref:ABC transporter ATP-binding protein n=1 Tax=Mobilicoccus sp. TaxID=2034349 RepID=UPI0028A9715E|nr:ABC transporter ATP-binding protein [Mobilicoccus sp.]
MSTPPVVALAARSLTRRFGDLVAVDEIDLDVRTGSIFGLLGPDGAGKTTLIRMLATVLDPTDGDAHVLGLSVTHDRAQVTPRIGYMPQRFCMYPDLTIAENIDYFATLRGVRRRDRRTRSARLLESMGLAEFAGMRSGTISGGMKQKLMLASTLMHEPDVLLLDEPTTGVDPVSRREFWRLLAGLHREGRTILVATPYMDEAERCTDIAFLRGGAITIRGTQSDVAARVPGVLLEVGGAAPRDVLGALQAAHDPRLRSAHLHGDVVRVLWEGPTESSSASLDSLAVHHDSATRLVEEIAAHHGVPGVVARRLRVDMEAAFAVLAQERA